MPKVLVTGGAGFIGSHVVDQLLAEGHEVHVVDDLSTGSLDNVTLSARFHKGDIREPATLDVIRGIEPEVVIHAAAQMSVRSSMDDPKHDVDVNVLGLVNLLQLWTGAESPFFVFLSTGGAVYGEQETFPAAEDHPLRPESVYGMSKRVGELYLDLWHRKFGLKHSVLRLANVYGPRQSPHGEAGVVAIFAEKLLGGQEPVVNGSGDQTRDFIHVSDVVQAVCMTCRAKAQGIFNVGTGRETSINEVARLIAAETSAEVGPRHGPAKPGEQHRSVIDPSLAAKRFGWAPAVTLEEGIRNTCEWFKARGAGRAPVPVA